MVLIILDFFSLNVLCVFILCYIFQAVPHSRRETNDSFNHETFGSSECTSEDRAEEERKRRGKVSYDCPVEIPFLLSSITFPVWENGFVFDQIQVKILMTPLQLLLR